MSGVASPAGVKAPPNWGHHIPDLRSCASGGLLPPARRPQRTPNATWRWKSFVLATEWDSPERLANPRIKLTPDKNSTPPRALAHLAFARMVDSDNGGVSAVRVREKGPLHTCAQSHTQMMPTLLDSGVAMGQVMQGVKSEVSLVERCALCRDQQFAVERSRLGGSCARGTVCLPPPLRCQCDGR
jgi:hypothetical protein